jgi:general nucleoside transport system permease protein
MTRFSFLSKIRFLEKRVEPVESAGFQVLLVLGAVVLALLVGSLFFLPFGITPISAYVSMITKAFGDAQGLAFTAVRATPLIFAGLAAIVAWETGFFYLGFDGAMYIGAICGTWFTLNCVEGGLFGPLPGIIFFPLVMLVAFAGGGVWAGIVGVSKARFGGNEVIVSLMSNYVAILLISFLTAGPMREQGQQPQTPRIPAEAQLPFIIPGTRLYAGILIAIVCIVLTYILLRKTRLGYQMIASGSNKRAAQYSGINVGKMIVISAFIAGGIAGLGGLVEVLGVQFRVMEGITKSMGFIGMVTALLGRLNPFGLGLASFLYAGMNVGAEAMQRSSGIPTSVAITIQGLIVMVLFVFDIFRNYRLVPPWTKGKTLDAQAEVGVKEVQK